MKTKTFVITAIMLFALTGWASATHEQINETLYIYNSTDFFYRMQDVQDTNCEKVVCDGGITTRMGVEIAIVADYSLDYELNYAPNESVYFTTIVTIKQEEISSTLFGMYKKVKRTMLIDAIEVATYNTSIVINTGTRSKFAFQSVDKTATFGKENVNNVTLFFSEMVIQDQYDLLENETGYVDIGFKTSGEYGASYDSLQLGGFSGIFLTIIKKMPFIGDSLYNVLFPVVLVMQYMIDFSFLLINLIVYDWWYALILLECACMFVASQKNNYVDILSAYINTHVQITMFVYHKIMIPMLTTIISVLNTIKNMIQWW